MIVSVLNYAQEVRKLQILCDVGDKLPQTSIYRGDKYQILQFEKGIACKEKRMHLGFKFEFLSVKVLIVKQLSE